MDVVSPQLFTYLILVVLGFELRASHLLADAVSLELLGQPISSCSVKFSPIPYIISALYRVNSITYVCFLFHVSAFFFKCLGIFGCLLMFKNEMLERLAETPVCGQDFQ
jgi:hypothetical protein